MDEQIFAIQRYGGISRLFSELAKQFTSSPNSAVNLLPMNAPIVNRYVLDNPKLRELLKTTEASSSISALTSYLLRRKQSTNPDLIHNTFYLPHGLADHGRAKRIVTIHDMIPELMPNTRRRLDFLTLKRRYVAKADHIICVSEATRNDLVRLYPEISVPISVVYHGVDPVFAPGASRPAELPENYILFVGNRGQYKDASLLLNAFQKFSREIPGITLLFVGGGHFSTKELRHLESLGLENSVKQRSLPDAEMSAAYGNALFTVFPSRFEGFGLPALESMACGTATILANSTSLPEIGGEAALYFTSGDVTDLTEKMLNLASDSELRDTLSNAGIVQAEKFTWQKCAHQTAQVYQQTIQG